jgi:hypothetical protein
LQIAIAIWKNALMPFNVTRSFESTDPQTLTRNLDDAARASRNAEDLVHGALRHVVQGLASGNVDFSQLAKAATVAQEADEAACLAAGAYREAVAAASAGDTARANKLARETQTNAAHARVRADDAISLVPEV